MCVREILAKTSKLKHSKHFQSLLPLLPMLSATWADYLNYFSLPHSSGVGCWWRSYVSYCVRTFDSVRTIFCGWHTLAREIDCCRCCLLLLPLLRVVCRHCRQEFCQEIVKETRLRKCTKFKLNILGKNEWIFTKLSNSFVVKVLAAAMPEMFVGAIQPFHPRWPTTNRRTNKLELGSNINMSVINTRMEYKMGRKGKGMTEITNLPLNYTHTHIFTLVLRKFLVLLFSSSP